ncbi:MAG: VWA domain-containing protein, partial [Bacteroidales bacterium]|nr:VWA domain-containing protein [Bacteroidales bacterium]
RKMKDEAKYVLRKLYNVSNKQGNIRVGLIGFNTVKYSESHTWAPIPLTYNNLMLLNKKISSFKADGGTALYYSINKAAELLQKDYNENISSSDTKFAGSAIIAFTDGHDNTSTDEKKGYSSSKEYVKYTKDHFPKQKVNDTDISSFIVAMRGDDILSDNIWEVIQEDFRVVAKQFYPIYKIEELHGKFDEITNSLIERNTVLNLYVAKGISGRVGWTFPEEKEKAPKQPKQPGKFWLGICAEGGTASEEYKKYRPNGFMYESGSKSYFFYGLGIDATLPLASWFGLGASFSLTMNTKKEDKGKISGYGVGPLMKFTFNNASALLMGAGIKKVVSGTNPYVMLGWKFRSPWYVKGFVTINDGSIWDAGLGVGISLFGGRNKKVQPADAIENEE